MRRGGPTYTRYYGMGGRPHTLGTTGMGEPHTHLGTTGRRYRTHTWVLREGGGTARTPGYRTHTWVLRDVEGIPTRTVIHWVLRDGVHSRYLPSTHCARATRPRTNCVLCGSTRSLLIGVPRALPDSVLLGLYLGRPPHPYYWVCVTATPPRITGCVCDSPIP